MGKGENAGKSAFSPFSTMFQYLSKRNTLISRHIIIAVNKRMNSLPHNPDFNDPKRETFPTMFSTLSN